MPLVMNEPMRFASRGDTHVVLPRPYRADTFTTVSSSYPSAAPMTAPSSYAIEREAFRAMEPMLMARHAGEFVAIKGGQVVDHDRSRRALARRFFGAHGNVPVCIAFVGPQRVLRQATPFRARRA